jgi:two-component system, HptB-dependent secretion and biofilm response regulator
MIERPPFQTGNLRKAAIPDLETFRKIRDNTHSIGDICSKMNRQLKALLPAGLFLCARLIELDYTAGKIHVWSSGLPDLIIRGEGEIRNRVSSNHPPMGVLRHEKFDSSVKTVNIKDGDYIYLFSDGVTEAENKKGEMFTQERIEKIVAYAGNSGSIISKITEALNLFCHGVEQTDDISLVEIEYRSNAGNTRNP